MLSFLAFPIPFDFTYLSKLFSIETPPSPLYNEIKTDKYGNHSLSWMLIPNHNIHYYSIEITHVGGIEPKLMYNTLNGNQNSFSIPSSDLTDGNLYNIKVRGAVRVDKDTVIYGAWSPEMMFKKGTGMFCDYDAK